MSVIFSFFMVEFFINSCFLFGGGSGGRGLMFWLVSTSTVHCMWLATYSVLYMTTFPRQLLF